MTKIEIFGPVATIFQCNQLYLTFKVFKIFIAVVTKANKKKEK